MSLEIRKNKNRGPVVTADGNPYNYLVIIDSGSNGSRCYVYHYPGVADDSDNDFAGKDKKKGRRPFPHVHQEGKHWRKKIRPGIAKLVGDSQAIHAHVGELLRFAESIVPKVQQPRTPVFLHATGGVRLLKPKEQHELLRTACEYTQQESKFFVPDCDTHFNAITGQEEGIFGWLGLNYLIGGLDDPSSHDHGDDHYTYGFLDMGGASTQIAFIPNATEIDHHKQDLFKVQLTALSSSDDQLADVYSESFNGLGVNEARRSYLRSPSLKKNAEGLIEDPCVPKGLKSSFTKRSLFPERDDDDDDDEEEEEHKEKHKEKEKEKEKEKDKHNGASSSDDDEDDDFDPNAEFQFIGTGDADECDRLLDPLLDVIKKSKSPDFDFEVNHFVGVSEYWDTSDGFEMGGNLEYSVLSDKVKDFCNTPWSKIVSNHKDEFPNVKMKDLKQLCFKSSWLLNVINDGFNFPEHHGNSSDGKGLDSYMHPLQSVEAINGVEYSWTLGRAFLYAASELGSNGKEGGLQHNSASSQWKYGREAGPWRRPDFKEKVDNKDWDKDWDELFEEKSHRLWGSLVFLGILGVVAYLLLGRQRRKVIWQSVKAQVSDKLPDGGYVKMAVGDGFDRPITAETAADYELGDIADEYTVDSDEESAQRNIV